MESEGESKKEESFNQIQSKLDWQWTRCFGIRWRNTLTSSAFLAKGVRFCRGCLLFDENNVEEDEF